MATSSITANFYTDDPKAANAIVHALFTETSSPRKMPPRVRFEVKHSPYLATRLSLNDLGAN